MNNSKKLIALTVVALVVGALANCGRSSQQTPNAVSPPIYPGSTVIPAK